MSDDNKSTPDPRYSKWDQRSRPELKERSYEAVDKRRDATKELIPKVIEEELNNLGLNGELLPYDISDENVMRITHELINKQINEWKGLRWWKFKNKIICWQEWFKASKCWQDQNQFKPLGRFWCLIFDELNQYTKNIASKFCEKQSEKNKLEECLYYKCIVSILQGCVKFERTRETPLLPVTALSKSKELQEKLFKINNGFTLLLWIQNLQKIHKESKNKESKNKKKRLNIAVLLNKKCLKHAIYVYQTSLGSLKQILPNLNSNNINANIKMNNDINDINDINNINNININNGYGPSRGPSLDIFRAQRYRYSPLAMVSGSDLTSMSDEVSVSSNSSSCNNNINESFELGRLSMENRQLRAELDAIKKELSNKREKALQSWVRIFMEQPHQPNMHLNNDNNNPQLQYYDDTQTEFDFYSDYPSYPAYPPYPPYPPPCPPQSLPPFQPGFAEHPFQYPH